MRLFILLSLIPILLYAIIKQIKSIKEKMKELKTSKDDIKELLRTIKNAFKK